VVVREEGQSEWKTGIEPGKNNNVKSR